MFKYFILAISLGSLTNTFASQSAHASTADRARQVSYTCTICEKKFSPQNIVRHFETHENIIPSAETLAELYPGAKNPKLQFLIDNGKVIFNGAAPEITCECGQTINNDPAAIARHEQSQKHARQLLKAQQSEFAGPLGDKVDDESSDEGLYYPGPLGDEIDDDLQRIETVPVKLPQAKPQPQQGYCLVDAEEQRLATQIAAEKEMLRNSRAIIMHQLKEQRKIAEEEEDSRQRKILRLSRAIVNSQTRQ